MKCGQRCEVWALVPGVANCLVSSLGRVKTTRRHELVIRKDGISYLRVRGERIHSINMAGNYPMVSVNDQTYLVHRLVALAFFGEPPFPDAVINHKDGDKTNNAPENLEWCSCSENEIHSHRVLGKQSWNKGASWVNYPGLATRKKNYLELCHKTMAMRQEHTTRHVAEALNISMRQVQERCKTAKQGI